jgi:hypothetical protein
MSSSKLDALDYFAGGVPTGGYFEITLRHIKNISDSDQAKEKGINRLQELCLIGLLSYFEAFCKDHFASIINLESSLITALKNGGQDVSVDARHVTLYGKESESRMGFVLASNFDFGTPQKINALFGALLKITPFSKTESKEFGRLLRDRHLLVHHGGILTLSYLEQLSEPEIPLKQNAFFNSCVVGKVEVSRALVFIEDIAKKLLRASHRALVQHLKAEGVRYSGERKKALNYMLWWDDERA